MVAESLDRLSRDLADVVTLYKHLSYLGVRLRTVAEGEITELHVGPKGTMPDDALSHSRGACRRRTRLGVPSRS